MSHRDYDLWLWLGLGAFLFIAIKTVRYQQTEIARLNRIPTPPPLLSGPPDNTSSANREDALQHDGTGSQFQEDAIPLSTLATLATESPSYDIREAATRIICDRFSRSEFAVRQLRLDLDSTDKDVVDAARTAIQFLQYVGRFDPESFAEPVHHGIVDGPMESVSEGGAVATLAHPEVLIAGLRAATARPHEESEEEARLRRRRREAMVLADDGSGPLTQENIIQRNSGLLSPPLQSGDERNANWTPSL